MKLVVLAGAKKGAAVPIKRSSFTIGRSKECSLRAGSEAISRKHCELLQTGDAVIVRDLGSRNGTLVNDEKIEGDQTLQNGDTITVGPLRFRFECEPALKAVKAPKVRNVGEAVARAATKTSDSSGGFGEEDISEWLLGDSGEAAGSISETLVMKNDETQIGDGTLASAETQPITTGSIEPEAAETEEAPEEESAKGGKKKPGKLPFRPPEPEKAKDSREAAANVLREMARRR